jgi:hypothetical protein
MIALVFIIIYFVSFAINLIICYQDNKRHIFNVGDLLDEIEFYMWCPILNTLSLIIIVIGIIVIKLWTLSKLDILWENFKNIKLKK